MSETQEHKDTTEEKGRFHATAEYMAGKIEKDHEAYEITWTNGITGKKIVLTCKVIEPSPEAKAEEH